MLVGTCAVLSELPGKTKSGPLLRLDPPVKELDRADSININAACLLVKLCIPKMPDESFNLLHCVEHSGRRGHADFK